MDLSAQMHTVDWALPASSEKTPQLSRPEELWLSWAGKSASGVDQVRPLPPFLESSMIWSGLLIVP